MAGSSRRLGGVLAGAAAVVVAGVIGVVLRARGRGGRPPRRGGWEPVDPAELTGDGPHGAGTTGTGPRGGAGEGPPAAGSPSGATGEGDGPPTSAGQR